MRTRTLVLVAMSVWVMAGAWAQAPAPAPAPAPAADTTPRFVQDRFAIGFWVDPPFDAKAEARYQEIADANFTFVIGGFGGEPSDAVARLLALCEKHDLRILLHAGDTPPDKLPDSPACWGYGLRDEPGAADFPALRDRVAALRLAKPGKLAYINLFPNYASEKQLGTPTYDEHVAQFVNTVNPDVLSMDHYPQFRPGTDTRDAYCANLDVMRRFALEKNIPFWNFFNIMPYGPHTDPTEAQVRWQIYASITYGARGVMYFCYYTPAGGEFPKGGAIIARDDRKTRHYDQARRINGELKKLGPTLMQLTSTRVLRVKPGDDVAKILEDSPVKALARASEDPEFDGLIGVFRHSDGRRAVLLMNYHFAYCQWPTVEFDVPAANVLEVSKESGEAAPVIDDSPDIPGLQISLDAGDGRLFLLPAK